MERNWKGHAFHRELDVDFATHATSPAAGNLIPGSSTTPRSGARNVEFLSSGVVHARAHDHDARNQTNINSTISYFGFEHSVNFIAPNRGALANSPVNAVNLEMHLLGHPDCCQVNYVLWFSSRISYRFSAQCQKAKISF